MPTNIAPIPTAWGNYQTFGDIYYTSVWPPSANQITDYDTTVERTFGQGSIRINHYVSGENIAREVDSTNLISCKAGDRIVLTCYMKTSSSQNPINNNVPNGGGARLGIDFIAGNTNLMFAVSNGLVMQGSGGAVSGYPLGASDGSFIYWNTPAWTLQTLDYIVPSGYGITSMLLWMQVLGASDTGVGWFADASLIITPVDETPLVEPSYSAFTLSDNTVLLGDSTTCSVTVAGSGATPTGTVLFYVFTDGEVWTQLGIAVSLDAGGSATSIAFTPLHSGTYLLKAEYSGDTVYTDYSSTNSMLTVSNPVTVTSPLLTSSFSVFTISDSLVLTDKPVSCSVTVTGAGATPTGTVTYSTKYNASSWIQLGVPVALDAGGSTTSINFYPSLAGSYLFKAVYNGDSVYDECATAGNLVVVTSPVMLGTLGNMITQMEKY